MPCYRSIPNSNNVESFDDSSVTLLQNIERVDAGSFTSIDNETIVNTPTTETSNAFNESSIEESSTSRRITTNSWNETMKLLRGHVALRKANPSDRCKNPKETDINYHDISLLVTYPEKKWQTAVNSKSIEVTVVQDQIVDAASFNHAQIAAYAGPIFPGSAQIVGRRMDQVAWLFKDVLSAKAEQQMRIQLEKAGYIVWLEPEPAVSSKERSTIIFQTIVNSLTPASMDAHSRNGLIAIGHRRRFAVFYYKLGDYSKGKAERESDFAGVPGPAGADWSSIGTVVNGRVNLDFNVGFDGSEDKQGRNLTVMVDVVLRSFERKAGASTKLDRAKRAALGRGVTSADNQSASQSVLPGGQSSRHEDHDRKLIDVCAAFDRLGLPYL